MAELKSVIRKRLNNVFVLDVSKLSRLLNVIEDRFQEISKDFFSIFEITTKKGKTLTSHQIESIVEFDNAVNNPISEFTIRYQDIEDDPKNMCEIYFDKEESKIRIKIECTDPKKGNDLFAEVEEQLERTFVNSWLYSLKKLSFADMLMIPFVMMIVFVTFVLLFIETPSSLDKSNYLTREEIVYFQEKQDLVREQSEKVNFIYELLQKQIQNIHSKNVATKSTSIIKFSSYLNYKTILIALPILIVTGGIFYIIKLYPGSIFLWGDYKDHFASIIERRKFVWNTIIIALLVGVIGNLFVFGFSQYL